MQEINGAMIGLDKSDTMAVLFKDPPIFRNNKGNYIQFYTNKN